MIRLLIPLGVFAALFVLLIAGLDTAEDRKIVQTPLIGKPAPAFELPRLDDPARTFSSQDELDGSPYLVNVWASYCVSCRQEHPWIERLGREAGIPLVGLNWKDEREDALRYLDRFGDAWWVNAMDQPGGVGIEWGVYGTPETFLVDHQGIIRHKHIGPINQTVFEDLMRKIMELRSEAGA